MAQPAIRKRCRPKVIRRSFTSGPSVRKHQRPTWRRSPSCATSASVKALRVIAVHVPQSEAEKDPRAVRDAIARLNLTEPCALDNEYQLRNGLLNGQDVVPAYYPV